MKNIKMIDRTMKLNLANTYVDDDVTVEIPEGYLKPENTIEITENGIVDVSQYASAEVSVPAPSLKGTAVPIGKPIDKIYFNTSLSTQETINYLKELTYIQTDLLPTPIYCPFIMDTGINLSEFVAVLIAKNAQNDYSLFVVNSKLTGNGYELQGSKSIFLAIGGWHLEITVGVDGSVNELNALNNPSLSDFQGLPIGLENEKIKNVISMTPFVTEGIYPVGELEITENGEYDVTNYASAKVSVASSGGGEVGDGYKIRYIDVDGTVLKTEYVPSGGKLTPPSNPTYDSEYLEFDTWNYDIDNYIVNGNTDVGAIYRTKTGDSYLFIRLTENIGLEIPTLAIIGATSIDWGDGTVDTNLTHTYADYGDYVIKISGMTRTTNPLFSSNTVSYCYSLLKWYLGDTVTSIGSNTLYNCTSLASIVIPESVTSIEKSVFNNCYSLTSIVIPGNVTKIERHTLYNCYSLTNIVIPKNVTSIEDYVFNFCMSLTSITIPERVTSIGNYAFSNCQSLINYIFNCTSVPTLPGTNTFSGINKAAIIWVKDELVESYKSATNWSTYATYIKPISAMPEKLKEELGL